MRILTLLIFLACATGSTYGQECSNFDYESVFTASRLTSPGGLQNADRRMKNNPMEADVILMGDSLPQGWSKESLDAVFEGSVVANYGVGGSLIENTLWFMTGVAAAQPSAHLVILWVGTNNWSNGAKPCAIQAGLVNLLVQARLAWPKAEIALIGLSHRGAMLGFNRQEIEEINNHLALERLGRGYRFIDINKALDCWGRAPVEREVTMYADDRTNFTCRYYRDDWLHLTEEGYEAAGNFIRQQLVDILD